MAGLEWASGLPGSVGGAVVGNAGAFEGDVAGSLVSGSVLAPDGRVHERSSDWFRFGYRASRLKRAAGEGYVLTAAEFRLTPADQDRLKSEADEIVAWRRTRHPVGATMGSTFKNPPGSHAGYLIEQAGLRGWRIGGAEVSSMHGNFLMNTGTATSADVEALIDHVRSEVMRQYGIELELEIELIGP
jgi:UDP-N-acetylmuramate dehydrogenase